MFIAGRINFGCQRPNKIRGARRESQEGCIEIISCMSLNNLSGSLWTLISTLNCTCWFSGYHEQRMFKHWYRRLINKHTLMSSSIVSENVGMACFGSLTVRACSIPFSPYQLRSFIQPTTDIIPFQHCHPTGGILPVELVVLERSKRQWSIR